LARIDHIFEPSSWCSDDAHTFTITGSDHRGIATTIGPCR
jgi:endonuclease/exonuclease/phosphatase (EEP) superfamily protein YafD